MSCFKHNRAVWLAVGVIVGMACGNILPNRPLHASASYGQENFIICTAELDAQAGEAVVFLDGLTGELKAAAIDPVKGKFAVLWEHSTLLKELGIEAGKSPKLLMVSGVSNFKPSVGSVKMSRGVIYICDTTSGKVAAYGLPHPNNGTTLKFRPLDIATLRAAVVRPS